MTNFKEKKQFHHHQEQEQHIAACNVRLCREIFHFPETQFCRLCNALCGTHCVALCGPVWHTLCGIVLHCVPHCVTLCGTLCGCCTVLHTLCAPLMRCLLHCATLHNALRTLQRDAPRSATRQTRPRFSQLPLFGDLRLLPSTWQKWNISQSRCKVVFLFYGEASWTFLPPRVVASSN